MNKIRQDRTPQQFSERKVLFNHHALGGEHLVFKDDNVHIYPIDVQNDKGGSCFSYICQPKIGKRTFDPKKAKEIKGLEPAKHFKLLTLGQNVTLEDGTIVASDQVCKPADPS